MMGKGDPQPAAAIVAESAPPKCPLFPVGKSAPIGGAAQVANLVRIVSAAVLSHLTSTEQIEAQYRVSFSRAWQKRGPPALLS